MSFSDWVNKKHKEKEEAEEQSFVPPFTKVGDTHAGSDYRITCHGPNTYKLYTGSMMYYTAPMTGNYYIQAPSLTNSYRGNEYTIDANLVTQVMSGVSMPQFGLPRMTDEQKQKLKDLNTELENWKKHQKLTSFKALPSHIRQEVVDEMTITKMVKEVSRVDVKKFPDWSELEKLQALDSNSSSHIYGGIATASAQWGMTTVAVTSKYEQIISMFTLEEVVKAHMEASLEEELGN